MKESVKEKKEHKNVTEVTTVPLALGEIKENFSIYTNVATQSSQEHLIKQALKSHSEGNITEATKYYQNLINQGFHDHRVYSNLGIILKDIGKLKEAELSARKAIKLKPDFANAHLNLGLILNDIGKLKEAELSTRKAIKLKPNFAQAFTNLGIILKNIGKLKEAELSHRKAIEIKPDFTEAYYNLGKILHTLGNLEEAELSTRKAISLKSNFADAHNNLGKILSDVGRLEEAEQSYLKAIKYDTRSKDAKNNLISLLTGYKPKKIHSSPIYVINEEFKRIKIQNKDNKLITDNDAIGIYNHGIEIYRKYNLKLETNLSQIYIRNQFYLNCKRHKLIFNEYKVIPEFCFGCYKVQIEVDSIIELIKLFLVFNKLKLKNNNTRKCMIELRSCVSGFYKGLIYCLDLNEALEISKYINTEIQTNIRINLVSKVKRGCSEYQLEYPEYKEIRTSGDQPMKYNDSWRSIEKEIDQGNKEWGKSTKTIKGFNLNDFLIIRNWVSYAQKIGDQNVSKLTNEKIKGLKEFNYLKRNINEKYK